MYLTKNLLQIYFNLFVGENLNEQNLFDLTFKK